MINLREKTASLLDRALPGAFDDASTESRRQARLIVMVSILLCICCLPPAGYMATMGHGVTVTWLALTSVAMITTLPLFYVTGSIAISGNYLAAAITIGATGYTALTGGLGGGNQVFLGGVPLLLLMMGARHSVIFWTLSGIAIVVSFAVLETNGVALPAALRGSDAIISAAVIASNLFVMLTGMGLSFSNAQRTAQAELAVREDDLRRILDNVGDGLLSVDRAGRICGPSARASEAWFGKAQQGQTLGDYLRDVDPSAATMLDMGFDMLGDGFMPDEVVLAQMERSIHLGERTIGVQLRPFATHDRFLVVMSDVTAELEHKRSAALTQELAQVALRAAEDRRGLELLLGEGDAALDALEAGRADAFRRVHTLKGGAGSFGVGSIATLCHDIEEQLAEAALVSPPRPLTHDEIAEFAVTWRSFREQADMLLSAGAHTSSVPLEDIAQLRALAAADGSQAAIVEQLDRWLSEPAEASLERLAEQARAVATDLGKDHVSVEVDGGGVHTPRSWRPMWSAAVHLVRNAMDHGVDDPEGREASGKDRTATIRLEARYTDTGVCVAIADDGAGIDWARLAAKAAAHGLSAETQEDLVAALFADEVTTREEVTEVSGRGVGLAAVADVVEQLGGRIAVESSPQAGTRFELHLPIDAEDSLFEPPTAVTGTEVVQSEVA